jgi:hypothetical protein
MLDRKMVSWASERSSNAEQKASSEGPEGVAGSEGGAEIDDGSGDSGPTEAEVEVVVAGPAPPEEQAARRREAVAKQEASLSLMGPLSRKATTFTTEKGRKSGAAAGDPIAAPSTDLVRQFDGEGGLYELGASS